MVEDALGLTAYLYKREEAERKLEKTAENMHEVEVSRRELMPHLKFLQAQVKKIEESHALRERTSRQIYRISQARECLFARDMPRCSPTSAKSPRACTESSSKKLSICATSSPKRTARMPARGSCMRLEEESRHLRARRDEISRELGRIEGELRALERLSSTVEESIPAGEARTFAERVEQELDEALAARWSAAQGKTERACGFGTRVYAPAPKPPGPTKVRPTKERWSPKNRRLKRRCASSRAGRARAYLDRGSAPQHRERKGCFARRRARIVCRDERPQRA